MKISVASECLIGTAEILIRTQHTYLLLLATLTLKRIQWSASPRKLTFTELTEAVALRTVADPH